MKKAFLFLSFLGFLNLGLQAQDNPVAKADSIIFNNKVHDYGTIEQGGDGTCEFEFTNAGKEPIVLTSVRSSCGCTIPEWSREPVLPGQTSVIKVKYDTRRLGVINKVIIVNSNAINSTVILRITGNVVEKP
ncbi:MAG: DUF1573 domain-containing protein [Bacteroidales bacterium]|jgi:hypothetical protein|nr:DUF1573 domain-containing protein [Bacteroidales bacterium]